jgi:hypothetical protein
MVSVLICVTILAVFFDMISVSIWVVILFFYMVSPLICPAIVKMVTQIKTLTMSKKTAKMAGQIKGLTM